MNNTCSAKIAKNLEVTSWVVLKLATILTSITLGVIVYHRRRLKKHHIFSFNIILADFMAAFVQEMFQLAYSLLFYDPVSLLSILVIVSYMID